MQRCQTKKYMYYSFKISINIRQIIQTKQRKRKKTESAKYFKVGIAPFKPVVLNVW